MNSCTGDRPVLLDLENLTPEFRKGCTSVISLSPVTQTCIRIFPWTETLNRPPEREKHSKPSQPRRRAAPTPPPRDTAEAYPQEIPTCPQDHSKQDARRGHYNRTGRQERESSLRRTADKTSSRETSGQAMEPRGKWEAVTAGNSDMRVAKKK
ncbi:Hypothetical predicted protein [Pelobates cultripes]|uniref:Uncharacterized protein n=1 Tax=Pelobates cultripes TaxID=61616 RepID=A0AAD1VMQ2_PELCU|nr:Hypothetical predicted protein [Pelobates cultripes]